MRAAPQGTPARAMVCLALASSGPRTVRGAHDGHAARRERERLWGGQGCESLSLARERGSDPV